MASDLDLSDLDDPLIPRARGGRLARVLQKPRCLGCLGIGLLLAVALGIATPLLIEAQVRDGIRGDVVMDSEHASGFEQFANRGKDGRNTMEFYFFNLTNPHEVLKGARPHVEELGPWVYDNFQVRGDFEWDRDADTLAYREHTYYVFNREDTLTRTAGRFGDDRVPITTLNMLFLGMEAQVGKPYWHIVCDLLLWRNDFDRLFARRTVVEYITGYAESVHVPMLGHIPIKFPGLYPNLTREEDPNWQTKSRMRVGAKDWKDAYELVQWRGMESVRIECPWGTNPLPGGQYCPHHFPCCRKHKLLTPDEPVPVWGTATVPGAWDADANRVHGRNGEQFHPGVSKSDELIIFNDIIWRALRFVNKDGEEAVHKGIRMLRFTPADETFANATEVPGNARYYQFGPRGLLGNLSMIEEGCELFASLPHFLGADPSLREGVRGLRPDPRKHRMQIDVEPTLGQTMVEHVRAQVNGQLSHGERWGLDDWFPAVRHGTLVPIAWFDQVSEINDAGADDFKQIYTARAAQRWCAAIGGVLGALQAAILVWAGRERLRQRRDVEPDLT